MYKGQPTKELVLDRRVETSNSCARTLIFGPFSFITVLLEFFSSFYSPFSLFLWLSVLLLFSFFDLIFLTSFLFPLVLSLFFRPMWFHL
jgi:hypothetical protein